MGYENVDCERNGAESPALDVVGNGTVSLRGHPAAKSKTGGWKATMFVHAGIFGDWMNAPLLAGNLEQYSFGKLHLSIAQSTSIATNFVGVAYILPIFWGYVADSHIGKYYTVIVSSIICTAGWVLLLLSANLPSLRPPSCTPTSLNPTCPRASQHIVNWFSAGLYMIATGTAGLKPSLTAMAMDQFDETDPVEKRRGAPFFATYFANINVASLLACTVLVYIQTNVGFGWGWGIEGGIFVLGIVLFFAGTKFLRHTKPAGSALTRLAQVVVVAVRNARKPIPSDVSQLYETDEIYANKEQIPKIGHTNRWRFFDKAAIKPESSGGNHQAPGKWRLCTLTQVEEFKCILQLLPIWLTTIVGYLLTSLVTGVTVQQASTLDRKLGHHFTVPAASTVVFLIITSLIFIPLYEFVLVPSLRKLTGDSQGLSELKCMGIALFLAIISMIIAAQVEQKRVNTIKNKHVSYLQIIQGGIPMSIFWLLPQYAMFGVLEVLLGVNILKFFYAETPEHMKGLAISFQFSSVSFGYFASTVIVNTVNKYTKSSGGWLAGDYNTGGLKKYYYLLAIITVVNLSIFIALAHWYEHKKVQQAKPQSAVQKHPLKLIKLISSYNRKRNKPIPTPGSN